ncbi:MAG: hypothetical protein H0X37_06170 [Herpetosiphonaceae bacterium]|nr:hypothetical protein [Herpetosiphonaceae bacterium]
MAEVRTITQSGSAEPSFPLLQFSELEPQLRETSRVIGSPPLIGRTMYERLWTLINRAVRRGVSAAVDPVVGQQNEWNAAVADTLIDLAALAAALQGETSRLQAARHDR